jgi:hypothetical protein
MAEQTFRTFDTWRDVLVAAQAGEALWYQAPLDYRPVPVRVQLKARAHSIALRVFPPAGSDADPFTCGAAHLDRFRRI